MAHDVFVCHPTEQKLVADAVAARLEEAGIRCWIAPRDVVPGADFVASIVDAISSAAVLVVVFGAATNTSPHVMREVKEAVEGGIPVIPFRVEEVEPSPQLGYLLGPSHWLDAITPPLEDHLGRLVTVTRGILDDPLESTSGPPEGARASRRSTHPVRRRRRRWPWVLAALVISAVAAVFVVTQWTEPVAPEAVVIEIETTGLEAPGRQLIIGVESTGGLGGILAVGADFSSDTDGDAATWSSEDGGRTWQRLDLGLGGLPGTQVMTGITNGGPTGTLAVGYVWDETYDVGGPVVWLLEWHPENDNDPEGAHRPDRWEVVWDGRSQDPGTARTVMLDVVQGQYGLTAVGWDEFRGPAVWRSVDGREWDRVEGYLPGGSNGWMTNVTWGMDGIVASGTSDDANPVVWTSADGGDAWQIFRLDGLPEQWAVLTGIGNLRIPDGPGSTWMVGSADDTPVLWTNPWGFPESLTEDSGSWIVTPIAAEGSFDLQPQEVTERDLLWFLWGPRSPRGSPDGTAVHDTWIERDESGQYDTILLFGQKPGDDGQLDPAVWEVTFPDFDPTG